MKKIYVAVLIFSCSLLLSITSKAQQPVRPEASPYTPAWKKIDSLALEGLPRKALPEVESVYRQARREGNAPMLIKAVIRRMLFQASFEDEVFEKTIAGLREDIAASSYPATPVLHSLLAEAYWKYYVQNRFRMLNRSIAADTSLSNFKNWDYRQLIGEITRHYKLSLGDTGRLRRTPVTALQGVLAGDSAIRKLRPTLYDLLAHRALGFYMNRESSLGTPREHFSFDRKDFFEGAQDFAGLSFQTADTLSLPYQALLLLQDLTGFHLRGTSVAALADLELQRLGYVHRQSRLPGKDSLYVNALEKLMNRTTDHEIYSRVAYTLADFYHRQKHGVDFTGPVKKQDSLALITAVRLCRQAIERYPDSRGAHQAEALTGRITRKELDIAAEDVNLPGKPFRTLLSYTNVPGVAVRVFALHGPEADSARLYSATGRRDTVLEMLQARQPVQEQVLNLPAAGDHYRHRTELRIDSLPPGHYALLARHGDTSLRDSTVMAYTFVQVSGLSVFMRNQPKGGMELFVTERGSGKPVEKAEVRIYKTTRETGPEEKASPVQTLSTGPDGRGTFTPGKLDRFRYTVIRGRDTLDSPNDQWVNRYRRNTGEDQVKEQIHTAFFTDRGLYRPGQTVHFKGLFYKTTLKGSQVLSRKSVRVGFLDANGEEISHADFTSNESGTFHGTFTIPRRGLTGRMRLESEHGSTSVEVAEYKRPTFEVEFARPRQPGTLQDSLTVTGTARAFAGYAIGRAAVRYTVTRSEEPDWGFRSFYFPPSRPQQIASGEAVTDARGNFRITFFAQPDPSADTTGRDPVYTFRITADITAPGGETQSGSVARRLARSNLDISTDIGPVVSTPEMPGYTVAVSDLDGEPVPATVDLLLYRLQAPPHPPRERLWPQPDQFIMDRQTYKTHFPFDVYRDEDDPRTWERDGPCIEQHLQVDSAARISLEAIRDCPAGRYVLEINAEAASGAAKTETRYLQITHGQPAPPQLRSEFITVIKNRGKPGELAEFHVGTGEPSVPVLYERLSGSRVLEQRWITPGTAQEKVQVPIEEGDQDQRVQFTIVYRNRIYTRQETIIAEETGDKLDIRFTSFRNKLEPGQNETWTLQISTPGQDSPPPAAEMVATLYDASLDDIQPFAWDTTLNTRLRGFAFPFLWETGGFTGRSTPYRVNRIPPLLPFPPGLQYEELKTYWSDHPYFSYQRAYRQFLSELEQAARLEAQRRDWEEAYRAQSAGIKNGRTVSGTVTGEDGEPLPGVSVLIKDMQAGVATGPEGQYKIKIPPKTILQFSYVGFKTREVAVLPGQQQVDVVLEEDESALDEVLVAGYGGQEKRNLTGAVVRIRGTGNAAPEQEAADGDAFAPDGPPPPSPQLRKNFNETAFFYPQLRSGENGEIRIEFTLPESLTRWKMMGFAHTPGLQHGSIIKELIAQKPLSVTAHTPRFLRDGDRVRITARVVNLTDSLLQGQGRLKLLDALTLKELDLPATRNPSSWEAPSGQSAVLSWELSLPEGTEAVTYRVTAESGRYTDGEENTLPVLPNSVLLTHSLPFTVKAGREYTFSPDTLLPSSPTAKPYKFTLEYTANPAWYAVQALPYLMEFPYECAEQVFSRFYANSLATRIMNSSPRIRQVFRQWQSTGSGELLSKLEQNQELKTALLTETPWLAEAGDEAEQKKRLALLMDLNKMSHELQAAADQLTEMQLSEGAFPWFAGMYPSRFITQHILGGLGQLDQFQAFAGNTRPDGLIRKALNYVDLQILEDYRRLTEEEENGKAGRSNGTSPGNDTNGSRETDPEEHRLSAIAAHYLYIRSYFREDSIRKESRPAFDYYLGLARNQWLEQPVYRQGMLALALHRYGDTGTASKILRSLKDRALQSEQSGMYWAENRSGYRWYEASTETQALLIEAFAEIAGDTAAVAAMQDWLLRQKQTRHWKTTKATAAACYALLIQGSDRLDTASPATAIRIGGQKLSTLKPGLNPRAGTGYLKTSWQAGELPPETGQVSIRNTGNNRSWGAAYWQYFQQPEHVEAAGSGLSIRKTLYKEVNRGSGPVLIPVTGSESLQPGDPVKVRLEVQAERDYEYVHLKDLRAAAFEPVNVLSRYHYQDGLGYYQVTRDASTSFFITRLPKGDYVLEYELRVAHTGDFSGGFASIQSMYAPEFSANSRGSRVQIDKNE